MTIPYSHMAATARATTLLKILFCRWEGSVWQLIKAELILWALCYVGLGYFCKYNKEMMWVQNLINFAEYLKTSENMIMLPFLLGFFTMITINRWWRIYELMEWPDSVASLLAIHLRPSTSRMDEVQAQILRRTLAKHMQLSLVLLLREISVPMQKRFPSIEAINAAKLLLNDEEMAMFQSLREKVPKRWCLYWLPFQWLFSNLKKCYFVDVRKGQSKLQIKKEVPKGCLFSSKYEYLHVIKELITYRSRMGELLDYDWVAQPILAFTQAIVFAVYGFALLALFARQNFNQPYDSYVHLIWPIIEIGIYLAWLKTTLVMINPFGSDKDDFEVLWLTDRHWRVIYLILDEPWRMFPETTFTQKRTHHFTN